MGAISGREQSDLAHGGWPMPGELREYSTRRVLLSFSLSNAARRFFSFRTRGIAQVLCVRIVNPVAYVIGCLGFEHFGRMREKPCNLVILWYREGGGLRVRIDCTQVIETAIRSHLSKRRKRGSELHHK